MPLPSVRWALEKVAVTALVVLSVSALFPELVKEPKVKLAVPAIVPFPFMVTLLARVRAVEPLPAIAPLLNCNTPEPSAPLLPMASVSGGERGCARIIIGVAEGHRAAAQLGQTARSWKRPGRWHR